MLLGRKRPDLRSESASVRLATVGLGDTLESLRSEHGPVQLGRERCGGGCLAVRRGFEFRCGLQRFLAIWPVQPYLDQYHGGASMLGPGTLPLGPARCDDGVGSGELRDPPVRRMCDADCRMDREHAGMLRFIRDPGGYVDLCGPVDRRGGNLDPPVPFHEPAGTIRGWDDLRSGVGGRLHGDVRRLWGHLPARRYLEVQLGGLEQYFPVLEPAGPVRGIPRLCVGDPESGRHPVRGVREQSGRMRSLRSGRRYLGILGVPESELDRTRSQRGMRRAGARSLPAGPIPGRFHHRLSSVRRLGSAGPQRWGGHGRHRVRE